MKKQNKECVLIDCAKENCNCSCCDEDEVQEWIVEYLAFHHRMKDFLKDKGIKIVFKGDRVEYKNCSTGKECKFIKYATNKDIDSRPIDCKIYPYLVDWKDLDWEKGIVNLYFWDLGCPLVQKNKISKDFKDSITKVIKRDFSLLFYGIDFDVVFHDYVKNQPK